MPKHASASLAVLDLVMASPAQPAARRSPRRLCLLSARSDDQPLPRSDQKGKLVIIIMMYKVCSVVRVWLCGVQSAKSKAQLHEGKYRYSKKIPPLASRQRVALVAG